MDTQPTWHTSSYSDAHGGNCVEVAESLHTVKVRDTRHRHLGHLDIPAAEWRALLAAVRGDEL